LLGKDDMKTDHDVAAERGRQELRAALAAGEYYTQGGSVFFSDCSQGGSVLYGQRLFVPSGTPTIPVRATADAILVRYTAERKHWFAWIHA
jgi:hypothetical protein